MRALVLLALAAGPAWALEPLTRDPTAWPPALRQSLAAAQAASAAGPAAAAEAASAAAIRQVMLRDGKAYVVVGSRRYGVGDLLDGARIQRIDDEAVWLLEGGRERREPLYGGVEKKKPPAEPASPKKTKEKP